MIEGLPLYIFILFGLTVVASIWAFYPATKSKFFLILAIVWTLLQSILGFTGLYLDTESLPPKIMLFGFFPTLVLILVIFLTEKGKSFIDNINLKYLTFFHTIRIPVEVVLFLLYNQGLVSKYMTFEGTNFDLFSGITAPLIAFIAFQKAEIKNKLLLGWNVLCLLLLLNVVITAIFSIPSPFQKLAFDQPNIAVLYFPFNLLPTVIVPLVFFAHLAAIRMLVKF